MAELTTQEAAYPLLTQPTPTGHASPGTPGLTLRRPPSTPYHPSQTAPMLPGTAPLPVPEGFMSAGGQIQGVTGYAYPEARIIPVFMQNLGAGTNQITTSPKIPFPFVLRGFTVYSPPNVAGGNSDGKLALAVTQDPALTINTFGTAQNVFYPWGPPSYIYCPTPITVGPLWQVWPEGHNYLVANVISQGGATNVMLVCAAFITPLGDILAGD